MISESIEAASVNASLLHQYGPSFLYLSVVGFVNDSGIISSRVRHLFLAPLYLLYLEGIRYLGERFLGTRFVGMYAHNKIRIPGTDYFITVLSSGYGDFVAYLSRGPLQAFLVLITMPFILLFTIYPLNYIGALFVPIMVIFQFIGALSSGLSGNLFVMVNILAEMAILVGYYLSPDERALAKKVLPSQGPEEESLDKPLHAPRGSLHHRHQILAYA